MPRSTTFHLIPHTHWDREWYRSRTAFRARLVAAFGAVLDFLQLDPGGRFTLDGQTVILDDVLEVAPEWELVVAQLVHQRRLAIGPWYILADEQLPCGESLLRNLLEGSRDAALWGDRLNVLYSPDAFGHPAVLPALAAEFGIAAGVVWRGLAPRPGADRDLYRWRAPDGREIVVHHLPRAGYESGAALLESRRLAQHWATLREQLLARAVTPEVAVWVGADHRAPPPALRHLCQRLQRLESHHDVRLSTAGEYLAAVEPFRAAMPMISGALRWSGAYTWSLPGVHATRLRLKRRHTAAELLLLRHAEPLVALVGQQRSADIGPLLRSARRALLESQFHDTICGCVADNVAREQAMRLDSVHQEAAHVAAVALDRLTGHDPDHTTGSTSAERSALLLWNPAARRRRGIVTARATFFRGDVAIGPPGPRAPRSGPGYQPFALADGRGRLIPMQVFSIGSGRERRDGMFHDSDLDDVDDVQFAFDASPIGGLGTGTLLVHPAATTPGRHGLSAHRGTLANRFVAVTLSPDGTLRLDDLERGVRYGNVFRLEDMIDRGDSYTVSLRRSRRRIRVRGGRRWPVANGPLVAAAAAAWHVDPPGGGTVACRMLVTLSADSPLVRIRLDLDHRARDHRLRAIVPIGSGTAVRAGCAFGSELHGGAAPAPERYPAEQPVRTAPAQRFVAAGGPDGALAVLSAGSFEYEWTSRKQLALTLLRATGELSRNDLPERPGHAGWPTMIPDAQEPGRHRIDWALAPLDPALLDRPDRIEQLWEDAFLPLETVFVREFTGPASNDGAGHGVELRGDGLVFSAVKPADSGPGMVLRCYNAMDRDVDGEWVTGRPVRRASRIRADETGLGALPVRRRRNVPFSAPPRQMVSVLLEFEEEHE